MILARAVSVELVSKNITGLYVKKKRNEYEMQRCSFAAQACRKMVWKVEPKKYSYEPNEHRQ